MTRAALVSAAGLLFLASTPMSFAGGDDDFLPGITLAAGGQKQRGRLWSSTEYTCRGEGGSVGHGDGIPKPHAEGIELQRNPFRGRLMIDREEEPRIRLHGYTGLDESGAIDYGSGQKVRWRMNRLPREGQPRRWVVRFRTAAQDHVYLDLTGSWADPNCEEARDNGSYVFHIERSG